MSDLMDILCYFIGIAIRFLALFGIKADTLEGLTGTLKGLGEDN